MAALRDHNIPNPGDTASPINYGPILPNNFEIHPAQLANIERDCFYGNIDEDAHAHIRRFLSKVGLMKKNGVPENTLRLMLFPFTLKEKAERWLNNHPPDTSLHGMTCPRHS